MYKKLLSILTLLVVLCMGTTARAEKNLQRIDVSTAQQFRDALKVTYNNGNGPVVGADIHLLNDIDFTEECADGTAIENSHIYNGVWHGKITGAGVDENGEETIYALKNLNYTLFGKLDGVEISDLIIAFSSFSGRDTSSGMIADDCENTTITGVMFLNISAVGNDGSYDCDKMGTAVGNAKNSTFAGLLFSNCNVATDGQQLGHVAGYAENCKILGCITDAQSSLWADGNSVAGVYSNAYVGGICGEANNCEIKECVNMSIVSSDDDRIGGIVGYATNGTTLTDCRNGGVVKHCTMDGMGRYSRQSAQTALLWVSVGTTVASLCLYGVSEKYAAWYPDGAKTVWQQVQQNWDGLNYRTYLPDDLELELTGELKEVVVHGSKMSEVLKGAKQFAHQYSQAHGIILGALGNLFMYVASFSPLIMAGVAAVSIASYLTLGFYNLASDGPDEMGGIVGTMVGGGSILRCVNCGPVFCDDDDCGGIAGHIESSTIESCYNRTFVSGNTDVAGIVGYCKGSTVIFCLNTGCVTSRKETGYFGFIGEDAGDNNFGYNDNYYLYDEYKDHDICYSVSPDHLASGSVALWLNRDLKIAGKEPIWRQDLSGEETGDFYPTLATQLNEECNKPLVEAMTSNYSIVQKVHNGGEFFLAASYPYAQISLQNDIDISCIKVLMSTYERPFSGHINGNGHRISNFSYQPSSDDFINNDDADWSVGDPHDIALFPYATGATFENLIIDNFHISASNINSYRNSLLVGTADHCILKNIAVRNSDILYGDVHKWVVGGLVARAKNSSNSESDASYFENVTIESSCTFKSYVGGLTGNSYYAYLGGVSGEASETVFDRCHNASTLWAEDDKVGGICGYALGCGFVDCLNSGMVTGQSEVGGIVGYAGSSDIIQCVNVSTIYGDKGDSDNDHIGGIVGLLESNVSHVKYCLDFGDLDNTDGTSENGAIIGVWKNHNFDNNYVNNIYYYSHNKNHSDNLSVFGYTKDDLYSGKFAYEYKNADGNRYLYQSLDNDPYFTDLPVPLAAAGKVYRDYFCFRSNSLEYHYSNIYQSHSANDHSAQAKADISRWGFCSTCGNIPTGATVPTAITINNAADLVALSKGVRLGIDYSNTPITLANDIDCEVITDFMPIGTSIERPFCGTFNGNGHRIKNLHIKRTSEQTGVGLFGVVTGNTKIQGVIMDSSCSVDGGNSLGVGGLVGCMMTGSTSDSGDLNITECGNEARVHGGENTAGLVGGVYDKAHDGAATSECKLTLTNCYNAGSILGSKVCASLVGYGHLWVLAYDCYNIGSVTGYIEGSSMIHYNAEKKLVAEFPRLYQLKDLPADVNVKETVSLWQLLMGTLAEKLNLITHWGQNLGTDVFPTPTGNGKTIYHERSMSRDWGTAILPYTAKSDDDVQLYAMESTDLTSVDASITLKAVESVAANAPFFFKKKNASATSVAFNIAAKDHVTLLDGDAPSATVETEVPGWSLTGTYAGKSELTGVYFMAQDQLWFAEDAIEVPGFRAYLTYEAPQTINQASLRILVNEGGESTQIGEIHFYGDEPSYNLNGQRQRQGQKGMQVRNGKVVWL